MFNKQLITLAIILAAVVAALTFASYRTAAQPDGGFELAQRHCPNGRC